MKKILIIVLCLFLLGCNPQKRLSNKSNHLVEELLQTTDTLFIYEVSFINSRLLWYHDNTKLYGYIIKPYSTKKIRPINCINHQIDTNSVEDCFDIGFENKDPCFQLTLDGASVSMYVKNKKKRWCSVDLDCLFSKEYPTNSFPYQLKQDLSLLNNTIKSIEK